MRFKKGFTLAEILIVLMVIGVIATLTVPSMMKGVQDAQYKAGFKKAYNTISNVYSKMATEGTQPVSSSNNKNIKKRNQINFFIAMLENLSVRDITHFQTTANRTTLPPTTSGVKVTYTLNGNPKSVGTDTGSGTIDIESQGVMHYWITSDDGISYVLITDTDSNTCQSKHVIASQTTVNNMINNSCIAILVDVNGIHKRPNIREAQQDGLASKTLDTLTGDMYHIFIGKDGVTAGNKEHHAAARILADVK